MHIWAKVEKKSHYLKNDHYVKEPEKHYPLIKRNQVYIS